jgi:hypothetical protein
MLRSVGLFSADLCRLVGGQVIISGHSRSIAHAAQPVAGARLNNLRRRGIVRERTPSSLSRQFSVLMHGSER